MVSCKIGFLTVAAWVAVAVVAAQIDTPQIPPGQDVGDLFERAAASRFVTVGRVVKIEGVAKRMTSELLEKVKAEGDLSLILGGDLYTIRVENTVCRQTDFDVPAQTSLEAPLTIYIFLPHEEPALVNGHQREALLPDHRYLLFLVEPDRQTLEKWTEIYQLEPNRDYFRGEELSRGIVPLDEATARKTSLPKQPPVLEKITRLCRALRPRPLEQKMAALKLLEAPGDDILKKEATKALAALRDKNQKN